MSQTVSLPGRLRPEIYFWDQLTGDWTLRQLEEGFLCHRLRVRDQKRAQQQKNPKNVGKTWAKKPLYYIGRSCSQKLGFPWLFHGFFRCLDGAQSSIHVSHEFLLAFGSPWWWASRKSGSQGFTEFPFELVELGRFTGNPIFCLVKQLASGDFYVPEIQSIDINHISIHILSSSITLLLRLSSVQNSLLDE